MHIEVSDGKREDLLLRGGFFLSVQTVWCLVSDICDINTEIRPHPLVLSHKYTHTQTHTHVLRRVLTA